MNSPVPVHVYALAALLLTGAFLAGDETANEIEKRPLPAGVLLARAPDLSKWTVTYTYPKPPDKKTPSVGLQMLVVSKSKNIYYEQNFYTDGIFRQSWRMGDMQINVSESSHALQIYGPSSFASDSSGNVLADPAVYTNYSKTDFPGLEWASAQTYVGVQKQQGQECLVFQQIVSPAAPHSTTLYIDLQTRLPVLLDSPDVVSSYKFESLSQPLAVPSEIQQFLDKRAKAIKAMTTSTPSY